MNRRGFLSLLAPAAAALVAPELLVPKRSIFLPPSGGWPVDVGKYASLEAPLLCGGDTRMTWMTALNNETGDLLEIGDFIRVSNIGLARVVALSEEFIGDRSVTWVSFTKARLENQPLWRI
jgi:hypothetical protein